MLCSSSVILQSIYKQVQKPFYSDLLYNFQYYKIIKNIFVDYFIDWKCLSKYLARVA